MAKITFERFGGFLEPPIDFTLDLDTLPASEIQHLWRLIEDGDFFRLPVDLVGTPVGDEFIYTITVESGAMAHRMHTSEMSVPDALQPLINTLSILASVP